MTSRVPAAAWALAIYLALSLTFFALPIAGELGSSAIAADDIDASAYMWFFAWWPHALLNGLDPVQTDLIFVPDGYNLAWTTAMPGPSLVLAPLTLTLGPLATWNAIMLLGPALAAWTGFLLCRELTGALAPSLLGGYLFGFSPYVLANLQGGPNLVLVALLPVLVLLVVRHVRGSLGPRAFVVCMTLALAFQFLTSTEVLAMAGVFGATALAAAFALLPAWRVRLLETLKLLALAALVAIVLVSPILWSMLFEPHTVPEQALKGFPVDLASVVVPSPYQQIATTHDPGDGPAYANGFGYLGVPLAVLLGLFGFEARRSGAARLVLVVLAAVVVASLGRELVVAGEETGIPLPWAAFAELPALRYAIPIRFTGFTFLVAAVAAALWLAWRGGRWRWALALVAVAFLLPDPGNTIWRTPIGDPPLFEDDAHEAVLAESDRVITVPAWGANMRWHAEAGFGFRLAGGYVGAFPHSYMRYPAWRTLLSGRLTPGSAAELRRFVRDKGVTVVLVDPQHGGPWRRLFGTLGVPPRRVGGMLVYRLRPS
ncbi:MAG TPA: hypothetical protein VFM57_13235 [Thermoleophilaceae bacterium]|nr:hypothetical protein [Thermoleophilaceae bacterium]